MVYRDGRWWYRVDDGEDDMELVKGQWYIVKPEIEMNTAPGLPLRYCGTQEYDGETKYNFWEPRWRLWHWLSPEEVQPYEGTPPY